MFELKIPFKIFLTLCTHRPPSTQHRVWAGLEVLWKRTQILSSFCIENLNTNWINWKLNSFMLVLYQYYETSYICNESILKFVVIQRVFFAIPYTLVPPRNLREGDEERLIKKKSLVSSFINFTVTVKTRLLCVGFWNEIALFVCVFYRTKWECEVWFKKIIKLI